MWSFHLFSNRGFSCLLKREHFDFSHSPEQLLAKLTRGLMYPSASAPGQSRPKWPGSEELLKSSRKAAQEG